MMTVQWTTFMLILFLSFFDIRPLWAHEGHAYVMSTVKPVSDGQPAAQTQAGKTVAIQLDRNTRYRAIGVATSSATVRVGARVVVGVTEETNSLRAAEVRYAPVAPRTP